MSTSFLGDKPIITADDIFKLLSKKVPFLLKRSVKRDSNKESFFQESILLLKHVEEFITDIESGAVPTREGYEEAVAANDQVKIGEICDYFSRLRYHQKIMGADSLCVSQNLTIFRNAIGVSEHMVQQARMGLSEVTDEAQLDRDAFILNGDPSNAEYRWNQDTFPKEKCFDLVTKLREVLESKRALRQQEFQQSSKAIAAACAKFDELLNTHSSVLTLAINIHFINTSHDLVAGRFNQFYDWLSPSLNDARQIIQGLPSLLDLYCKLEHDFQQGLNLHCILIFKNPAQLSEEGIITHLKALLQSHYHLGYNGNPPILETTNWNDVIRSHCSKNAVGIINKSKSASIEQFKYWVLSYFYRVDQYLKLEYWDQQDQSVPINFYCAISQPLAQTTPIPTPSMITFGALVTAQDEKLIWKTGHLSAWAIKRIQMAQLVYQEFQATIELQPLVLELLTHLEIFIETVLHSDTPVFNLPQDAGDRFLTENESRASVTRVGKQLLSLLNSIDRWVYLAHHEGWKANLSIQIRSFLLNLEVDHLKSFLLQLIGTKNVEEVNTFISAWRQSYYQLMIKEFSYKKESSYKNSFFKHTNQYDTKSMETYVAAKERTCQDRQKEGLPYVRQLFKEDCWLCRVNIKCHIEGQRINQMAFSGLFTEFIRRAKRSKPLSKMKGYFLLWQEDKDHAPYVDLIVFMNAASYAERSTFRKLLENYWRNFLADNIEIISAKLDKRQITGSITDVPLMQSVNELNQSFLSVESIDKIKQQLIIKQLLPYFTYRDLFQAEPIDSIPKAFTKGSGSRKKASLKEAEVVDAEGVEIQDNEVVDPSEAPS